MKKALSLTERALEDNRNSHWIVGFSGGKDSTALLKIFASVLLKIKQFPGFIDVIYCDTGVENPALDHYVKVLLSDLRNEFEHEHLPFRIHILKAPVEDRFFVKLIGRGYPPPTNNFRWCTKNLRIKPVSHFIKEAAIGDAIVSLGIRQSESVQRTRSVEKYGGGHWQVQMEGGNHYRIFMPIIHFDLMTVWNTLSKLTYPLSVDVSELNLLYRGASGECPVVKSPQAAPCASGRFGCWVCTVVRNDKSSNNLIKSGHSDLEPYVEFRNWLIQIRNDPLRRWNRRRNGSEGLGPFTLATRSEILNKIRQLEATVNETLIDDEEIDEITKLWGQDTY